jgi:hypothetical protein
LGLVGEQIEDASGRGHRIDAVVGHRAGLACLDRDTDERAVRDLRERRRRLGRDGGDERRRMGCRRAARLTPAARELIVALEDHMRNVAEELDAAR